jgi:hypothetical protein
MMRDKDGCTCCDETTRTCPVDHPEPRSLKLYMVVKNKKFLKRKAYHGRAEWTEDPQQGRVWTAYQGPAAAISRFGGKRFDIEVPIENS